MLPEQKEVTIEVSATGGATVDFAGFVGKACLKEANLIRELLAARGIKLDDTGIHFKPEFGVGQLAESSNQNQALQRQFQAG